MVIIPLRTAVRDPHETCTAASMRSPIVPDLLDSCAGHVRDPLRKSRRNLLAEYQSVTIQTIQGGVKISKPTATHAPKRRSEPDWRKHQEDRAAPMSTWTIDWFSSAAMFPGWAEYGEEEAFLWRGPEPYDPLVVYQPKTWLSREGWKKAGAISYRDVPSVKR